MEHKAIPPQFNINDGTYMIFILRYKNKTDYSRLKKYNKILRETVKKHYKGKHVFLHRSDIELSDYTNKEKFRYFFDYSSGMRIHGGADNTKQFYVFDRLSNVKYKSGYNSYLEKTLLKVYFKNLCNTN